MKGANGFGEATYWNRPTQGRPRKHTSKYPSIKAKAKQSRAKSASRSPSPTSSQTSTRTVVSPSRLGHVPAGSHVPSVMYAPAVLAPKSKEDEDDEKDERSIVKLMKSKLPQFSNEADWEISIFELGLVLDRVWPHKDELDIVEYMTTPGHRRSRSGDMETRADCLIYLPSLCPQRKTHMPNSKSWPLAIRMQSPAL